MRYLTVEYTDQGKRKNVNQDSMLILGQNDTASAGTLGEKTERSIDAGGLLAVVCDGMGGLQAGELASAQMTQMFSEWYHTVYPELRQKEPEEEFEDGLYESWENLFKTSHEMIQAYGKLNKIKIGTTATAVLFERGSFYIAHVGDTRVYEITDQVRQLTRDQNFAGITSVQRKYTMSTGVVKNASSILIQGIGASENIRPVYQSGEIRKGAVYLLCSDGFWHKTEKEELQEKFASEHAEEYMIKRKIQEHVKLLRERGERDDITVLMVREAYN